MCGICGFISRDNIKTDVLKRMNDTMYHRGPDDSGEEIYALHDGWNLGLAQRRLSIQDLSSMGHQPMHSRDKRITVVFNGEIYNFKELKKELTDYIFESYCDTEVIIAAYLKWGIKCVEKMHGMFAIALYDRETDELFLVRDRIGKKPLYYWYSDGCIVFASELKPIMLYPGFDKKINTGVLARYMYQQYINAPQSIFQNVYKLEPGKILQYNNGRIHIFSYWEIDNVYKRQRKNIAPSYKEAREELKELLLTAVKQRMIADVPVGTFLSGGYDSSLITALAQEISAEPVKTFTIGFNEEQYNEAVYARQVAEYLGTNHTELYIGEKEMFDMIESIPKYFDEPFADNSQIPSMLVSKVAKEQVTVALTGDGGDEFFCGYNIYKKVLQAQKLDVLGGMVHFIGNLPGFRQTGFLDKLPFQIRTIVNNRNRNCKTQLISDYYIHWIAKLLGKENVNCAFLIEDEYEEKNWQARRMLTDMNTYLPGDILCKVDRASMKYSLETRCPILDTEVMEYSFMLPHSYKYKDGVGKRILKDIVYDYIPKEIMERPKRGFEVPIAQWLRGPLREQLLDVSNESFVKQQELFQAKPVCSLVEKFLNQGDAGSGTGQNYSRILWSYFMFQKWYQLYM